MARPKTAPDHHLLTKVGTLYYLESKTQQEIADRLHLSRSAVSRLLDDARALGIVRIAITPTEALHIDLESALESRFNLAEAHVVSVDRPTKSALDLSTLRRQLGLAAANVLARTIRPGDTIGLAWGTTLAAMVDALVHTLAPSPTTNVRIVQILGGLGPPDAEAYAADLVRRLAARLHATPILLPAPGLVSTRAVREGLERDPHVAAALKILDTVDTLYAGIGSLTSNPILADHRVLSSTERAALRATKAVADIALRFLDKTGRPVRTTLDDRILGLTTAQLRRVPRVVAVAGGPDKIDAIHAALRSGLLHALVTDEATATAILARPDNTDTTRPARRR
jgi:DNA-binding transcriptional regulator LsrR (DeoR family)